MVRSRLKMQKVFIDSLPEGKIHPFVADKSNESGFGELNMVIADNISDLDVVSSIDSVIEKLDVNNGAKGINDLEVVRDLQITNSNEVTKSIDSGIVAFELKIASYSSDLVHKTIDSSIAMDSDPNLNSNLGCNLISKSRNLDENKMQGLNSTPIEIDNEKDGSVQTSSELPVLKDNFLHLDWNGIKGKEGNMDIDNIKVFANPLQTNVPMSYAETLNANSNSVDATIKVIPKLVDSKVGEVEMPYSNLMIGSAPYHSTLYRYFIENLLVLIRLDIMPI
ncbi:hypothetical protein L1887_20531 [Cichorium endivia]|nr:hypothetical protein L1887_20531 [Cichorium endivia]